MRSLVLVRHAAAGTAPGRADHDRPLTAEGQREAAGLVGRLTRHGLSPTLAVSSTAVRAEQTLAAVGDHLAGLTSWTERALYLATADELLEQVRLLPDDHDCVLLVGHNPGIAQLAMVLAADPDVVTRFPTAALAALRLDVGTWADVAPGEGALVAQSFP